MVTLVVVCGVGGGDGGRPDRRPSLGVRGGCGNPWFVIFLGHLF